ncbi:hypothetical protein EMIT0210MI2_11910 [Priestia megaterium]
MLKFLKSYLRIHGLKKFFIILLTTTFHSYFHLYFHNNKGEKERYYKSLFVLSKRY